MHRRVFGLGRVAALIALGGGALFAQGTQTANVVGDVVDKSGAPVAGATVRLTSPTLQGVRTATTDSKGHFVVRLLPPGPNYTIEVTKEGFQAAKINQSLGIDQTFNPRIILTNTQGTTVEVIASTPAVDKTDIKTATNYRMDEVDKLPNGRTMEAVAFLTPGVVEGVGGRVQVRGAMTSGNLYLLDGQNISDNTYNNRGVQVIADSIEETQILTGAISAEYGNVEGGVLNSVTKSGSNEFSGQLRWELANPAWNAKQPTGVRSTNPGLPNPGQVLENKLSEQKTLSLGGFIIKDKLWFFVSGFQTETNTPGNISGNSIGSGVSGGAGANYNAGVKEIRRSAKLTWAINQDHTLIVSAMNSSNDQTNRNYSAGELLALVPQTNQSEFVNATWRALWSQSLTSELKLGRKHQKLSAGGAPNGQSPFYLDDTGLFYNNGIFNSADGGDNRDNRTMDLKFSLFWNAMGTHQTDMGVNYYEGISKARNEQTPTGYIIEVFNMDQVNRLAEGEAIWTYQSFSGEAKNITYGLYVNDKWSVDQHLNVQAGIRWDKYQAKNEGGSQTAGASGFSPRLGVKYDLFGDSKWVFGASAARYNGKVLETITNSVTSQGNPTEIDYVYTGPAGQQNFTVLQDLANYDISPAGTLYYNDPKLNVRLNDKLKAPHVDEFQISAAYSFKTGTEGDGFIRATGVIKKWHDLIDNKVGNNGTVQDPTGATLFVTYWDNSKVAKREYKDIELDGGYNRGDWSFVGNITWAHLLGNYEGEGSSTPGRGEGLEAWQQVNNVQMFDRDVTAPYGKLAGHQPLRERFELSKVSHNAWGKTTWGWIYRFDSGTHYSNTRSITRARLNPALPTQFGSTTTQYKDGVRGAGVFKGSSYLDLAVTHEFQVIKVAGYSVNAFAKMAIFNVLNHQQEITFFNTWANATGTFGTANGGVNSPWVPSGATQLNGTAFGKNTSASQFGTARTINISAGFRF